MAIMTGFTRFAPSRPAAPISCKPSVAPSGGKFGALHRDTGLYCLRISGRTSRMLRRLPRRYRQLVCAQDDSDKLQPLRDIVQSPLYSSYLQGAVFIGILAAVDAAYSGDWSRIGVISTDTEAALRDILQLLLIFHMFCAMITYIKVARAGESVLWPVTKVLLVGGLAMFQFLLREEGARKIE